MKRIPIKLKKKKMNKFPAIQSLINSKEIARNFNEILFLVWRTKEFLVLRKLSYPTFIYSK